MSLHAKLLIQAEVTVLDHCLHFQSTEILYVSNISLQLNI